MRNFGLLSLALLAMVLLPLGILERPEPVEHLALKNFQEHSTSKDDGQPPRMPNKWFHAERAFPQGSIPQAEWQQAQLQARAMRNEARLLENRMAAKGQLSESWISRGPYNVGGRITSLAVDPADANTVFAGCAEGGILRSTNGGANWQPIFDDQPSLSVGAVAIDPNNSQVIYVGTGEVNPGGGSVVYGGTGVYRSTDGGDTWVSVGLLNTGSIGRIVIDPGNSDRIFVAAMGDLWSPNDDRGIYLTTDGGNTWQQVHFVDDQTGCVDIMQRPDQPDILFAAMWKRLRQPEAYDYGGATCAVWRSFDGGDTWSVVGGGLPTPNTDSGRIGLSLCAGTPDQMYAIYADRTGYFAGLYRSTNGGTSWTRTTDWALSNVYSSYGWWFGNVRAHPTDAQTLFVLGLDFFRSTTGGSSYSDVGSGVHVDHHALAFGPGTNPVIYLGNDGGLYRSNNGGGSWTFLGDQPITQIYRLGLDANNPNALYLGTQDNGTYRTVSGGLNDFEHIYGGDGFQPLVHATNSNWIWAQYQYGGLGFSSNGGVGFSWADDGISNSDRVAWNAPHIQDPTNTGLRYFGTHRMYRSTSNTSWTSISNDLTGGPHQDNNGQVRGTLTTLAVSPLDNEVLWSGSDDGRVHVYRGAFGGGWVDVSAGLPERWITSVRCDPFDRETAYVTVSGFRWGEDMAHIYRTENLGATWDAIDGNLPDAPVNEILPDPLLARHYYAATDLGVYQTVDAGFNWTMMGADLPNVVVNSLVYEPATRTLLAGTYGRSAFAYQLPEPASAVDQPLPPIAAGELLAPWPNPMTNSATFAFAARRDVDLTVEVYDLAGRRIWQRRVSAMGGQTVSVGWNGRDSHGRMSASGVYLVRALEGSHVLGSRTVVMQK